MEPARGDGRPPMTFLRALAGAALLLSMAACTSAANDAAERPSSPPAAAPARNAAHTSAALSTARPATASPRTAPRRTVTVATRKPVRPTSAATGTRGAALPRRTGPSSPATSTARTARPTTSPSVGGPALHGMTIVLNPGHNGADARHPEIINQQIDAGFGRRKACETTGTATDAGYPEHAFNWDVTNRVKRLLQDRGVTVIMTRHDDNGVGPCADVRAFIGNAKNVAATVSIHADGAAPDGHGFHICEDSHAPGGPAVKRESHALTVAVHDALERGSGLAISTYLGHDGYFPRDDLTGLNLATGPATFLELGNMRNAGDAARQSSAGGRQQMANAVAAGILTWLAAR